MAGLARAVGFTVKYQREEVVVTMRYDFLENE
jgi:acetyltransferase